MAPRVVVTGAGVVSAIAIGRDAFFDALTSTHSGAVRLDLEGYGPLTAFPAVEFEPEERLGRREARRMDRCGQLAAVAAGLALADAGPIGVAAERIGASVGCAHGGALTMHDAYRAFFDRGADRISPFTIPLGLGNTAAAAVARTYQLQGPSAAPCTACAAGSDAVGIALGLIREGRADVMVAGGAEAPLTPLVVAGYRRLGALSTTDRPADEASRPFDQLRDGFVIGEGAGFLVLERRDHARARGARILCELAGYGSSCDAGHLTDPDQAGTGPARAITAALADADQPPERVSYVNAHATATRAGDLAEARALTSAGLANTAVSSTKALHGHALGAAGGIEAVATVMAIVRGVLPPSANLDEPEPDPPLDYVRQPRTVRVECAVSNSFGFGGHNAALVFTAHDDAAPDAG